ncbi:MAG: TlyA family rRNA (cytidine-2'-O)-methyltransferase [Halobacteriovoraceae bacterium]|nr:TlyA family rRNA (cytidine-2'-O)-methyltransferase [Halobacteriovoraceae bacterium]|tara:strand:+ start:29795 stop:30514 length:720 start_codon:yes stop_codon:yes gene_type:complete
MTERLDKAMLSRGIVKTRSQARMLIDQGDVRVNGRQVLKPGFATKQEDQIEIADRTLYVGRGAYKLEKAIEVFGLDFTGLVVADIGASTGGFTEVSLKNGASKVYAIDVGHDQLAQILKDDERVINLEGVNAKYPIEIDEEVDAVVMDLSFISLRSVLKNAFNLLRTQGAAVVLIKPQFEAGPERVGKNGIVKESIGKTVLNETLDWIRKENIVIENVIDSPITGKTGNREYLALLRKA